MIEERLKYARTGHRDCCGDMIRRRDTVITRDGVGRVVWAGLKWWVRYPGRPAEALNKYPAAELRRVTEDVTVGTVPMCDNTCDNAVTTVCDNNPLSHVLSHPLSQPKTVEIQRIKP
jgi:hypothetical protein